MKFCIKCGVGDHSLEDFPIIILKIMSKKNVYHLSRVPKDEVLNTKNLHIITRQGTKVGEDKAKGINSSFQKYDYHNPIMQRKKFEDKSQVFKELAT